MPDAVTYTWTGGHQVLTVTDVVMPEPAPGQIRVKVSAAGAHLLDAKLRNGDLPWPQQFPVIPGLDAAGTVDALGDGGTGVAVGDRVFGSGHGSYAQYAILTAWCPIPVAVDYAAAAAIATTGETAFRALAHLALRPGQTLLIHGGGVGAIAVQLAVKQGLTVIATAGGKDVDYLRGLGATPISYGQGWISRARAAAPHGIDAVLDTAGAGVLPESIELTESTAAVLTLADMHSQQYWVRFTGMDPADRRYDAYPMLAQLLADKDLDVRLGASYRLDQAVEMHRTKEAGGNSGKLLLSPTTDKQ